MKTVNMKGRIAARKVARELTREEMELAAGGCASSLTGPIPPHGSYDTDCLA